MRAIIPPDYAGAAEAANMSPAIAAGDLIFVTGMTGSAPDGHLSPDPETQFRAAFGKIAAVLREARLPLSAIVEMTSYHVDIDTHFATFDRVRQDLFTAPYPAWTAVDVARLRRPGALVEVRAIASFSADAPRAATP